VNLTLSEGMQRWQEQTSRTGAAAKEQAAFDSFCDRHHLPSSTDAISLYLVDLADRGASIAGRCHAPPPAPEP
jgi:hypothetical protein